MYTRKFDICKSFVRYKYRIVFRLRHGIQLLRSTNLCVAEIAERVGFSSASGFLLGYQARMPRRHAENFPG